MLLQWFGLLCVTWNEHVPCLSKLTHDVDYLPLVAVECVV